MLRIARWSDGETVGWLSRNIGEASPEKPIIRYQAVCTEPEDARAWQVKEEDHKLSLRIASLSKARSSSS